MQCDLVVTNTASSSSAYALNRPAELSDLFEASKSGEFACFICVPREQRVYSKYIHRYSIFLCLSQFVSHELGQCVCVYGEYGF